MLRLNRLVQGEQARLVVKTTMGAVVLLVHLPLRLLQDLLVVPLLTGLHERNLDVPETKKEYFNLLRVQSWSRRSKGIIEDDLLPN